MPRNPNTHGGGANTNLHGLHFEQTTSLNEALQANGFVIRNNFEVLFNGILVGYSVPKYALYNYFLALYNIDSSQILSKKLLPDEAFVNLNKKTIYIIEKKFQSSSGSVDEKLQTCDFKRKQYQKLFKPLNMSVAYYYLLSDWFNNPAYADVLNYIRMVGCDYYFNIIPINAIGL